MLPHRYGAVTFSMRKRQEFIKIIYLTSSIQGLCLIPYIVDTRRFLYNQNIFFLHTQLYILCLNK